MPTARVGNADLYYEEVGSGPAIVLSPGALAHPMDRFRPVMPALATGHRVIAYDRRYGGRSRAPLEVQTWDAICADVIGLMDALGTQEAALGGGATGAAISLGCAARYPDRVTAVFPCNVNGGPLNQTFLMGPLYRSLHTAKGKGMRAVVDAFDPHDPFGTFLPAPVAYDAAYRDEILAMPADRFVGIMRRTIEALFATDHVTVGVTGDMLRSITAPVLVMHGRGDDLHPRRIAERVHAALPNARWSDVASFLPEHGEQDRFARAVLSFLADARSIASQRRGV